MGSDNTLKIAGRIFDSKRRIPVGRGREKAGRPKTSQPHTQAVGEVDTESLRAAHPEVSPGSETSRLGRQSWEIQRGSHSISIWHFASL